MLKPRPTLKSIAAELGITHTSVAHAFNKPHKISAALREKVLEHAKLVNYLGPNPAARSLRTGLCGSIGIIFNDNLSYAFSDPHDIEFLRGISSVCEEVGANIVLIPLQSPKMNNYEMFGAMVDGYILNAPYKNNPSTQRALAKGLPTVVVDFEDADHVSVLANDADSMKAMTRHILALGHQHIAIITFPLQEGRGGLFTLDKEPDSDNYVATQRVAGCREAIMESDVKLSSVLLVETPNSEEGGGSAAQQLLDINPLVTAFICFSDRLAFGAMAQCESLGLNVPQDISVTGFDGIERSSSAEGLPALTTIRQNAFDKGVKAAKALLAKDEAPAKRIEVETKLVIGGSTAAMSKRV